jgi:malto-oligosyltrehalose trehalohydrolase
LTLTMSRGARGFAHAMDFGAQIVEGGVRFRLWAPACESVELALEGDEERLQMQSVGEGWHELTTPRAQHASGYQFILPDGTHIPDPASRFQPRDVHGPSEVIDPHEYGWRNPSWTGRPWSEAIVYELHVGTFTPEGTFLAIIGKLDHLRELGVTAIEIMPIADFPGARNWGYDGVLLYAPDSSYGRPEHLKALVDAAHDRGIMVLLDVVYNHFGPDGNYLSLYAPDFFTERHQTPWGAAINYDGRTSAPVRQFVIQNALYWLEEFQLDGLRLDAVHAIIDDNPRHLLTELSETVRSTIKNRHVHLVLENEHNQAKRLVRQKGGEPTWYTAQWNDDVHHVLHTAATGESNGYYQEYAGDTHKLGRALAEGFAFQGETMRFSGKARGEPSADLPPEAFVSFIQNHDQVGNRAFGDRIGKMAPANALRAIAAVYLLLPHVPMLFMGEEWNAAQPFVFFCDFSGDLARAVSEGRRQEFAAFPEFQDSEKHSLIPDPQSAGTFASAKLDWSDLRKPEHASWLEWYQRVLRVRKAEIAPRMHEIVRGGRYTVLAPSAVSVYWPLEGAELALDANLSTERVKAHLPRPSREIWREGDVEAESLGPWSVRWSIDTGSGSGA